MRTISVLVLALAVGQLRAADPKFVVTNKTGPGFVVVNKCGTCTYCTDCKCAEGKCPSQCPVSTAASHKTLVNDRGETIHSFDGGTVWWAEGHGPAAGYATKLAPPVAAARPVAAPVTFAPQSFTFPAQNCPNGKCPLQR